VAVPPQVYSGAVLHGVGPEELPVIGPLLRGAVRQTVAVGRGGGQLTRLIGPIDDTAELAVLERTLDFQLACLVEKNECLAVPTLMSDATYTFADRRQMSQPHARAPRWELKTGNAAWKLAV
jgi:hypothetical protein